MLNKVDKDDFRTNASIETLQQRASILKRVRNFFDSREFFEVETPLMSHDIVVDRYLEPVSIDGDILGIAATREQKLWLQTSPEFGMKRILASGATAIYQISKAFRAGESGKLHNPEFTMLEWYRVGDDQQSGINLLGEFVQDILQTKPAISISYQQAFIKYAQIDPFAASAEQFQATANKHDIDVSTLANVKELDPWRNLLLTQIIEPQLGKDCPEIIYDWPASQSALAQVRDGTPAVAERFELYFDGIELANGYHELLSPNELMKRNQAINGQRKVDGKDELPLESRLLNAMNHGLPPCSGVALGIDRLVMLATGHSNISEVMSFDINRA